MFFTYTLELIRVRMAFATHKITGPSNQRPSFLSAMRRTYYEGSQPASSLTSGSGPLSSSSLPVADQAKTSLLARSPVLKFYRSFMVTTVGMIPYVGTFLPLLGLPPCPLLSPPRGRIENRGWTAS